MHTNPAVEQNNNIKKWSESPWNQSGMSQVGKEKVYGGFGGKDLPHSEVWSY